MRLTFKSLDWVKRIALPNVGVLIQSTEDLNRTMRLRKRELLSLTELGHWLLLGFGLGLKHQPFLSLQTASFQTGIYTSGKPGSPACQR